MKEHMKDNTYCLILAGGNGSRLWPISRSQYPKQFMDFFGTGRTLIQQTYDRVSKFIDSDHIYISTNVQYLPLVYEQLPQIDDAHILEEPIRRGTLAAVAWGTVVIAKTNPNANVFVTPSDQIIMKEEAYEEDILRGLDFVNKNEGLLVTGIRPTRPETEYGYIQLDDEQQVDYDIYRVKLFTEKPNAEFANIFLQEGNFLWNTGLLCFNVNVMLSNLFQLVPEYQVEIPRMMAEAEHADPRLVPEFFNTIPNLNIDVSVLDRSNQVYVQQGHFGWTDLGTWANLHEDTPADENGNLLMDTRAYMYESKNNIVRLPKGRTAVIKGLNDYVVAEEGDILMICPREDVTAMRKMHTDTKFSK